ncbi:hypothetical protein FX988_00050 [Paraglaciecola mesophila]|uniref:DUF3307 domain-containing protein n=1 Tax=Paraglaciecola mesophila TaxID=197222 RepID=A0A857JF26_9ALTE|nr:DUF3307 domain-containing protein [Paraglaciecola mesophila]QHJ09842.1 hypothetical protein FX988_00050 [Paraglaciecola mesophila]
MTLFLLMIVAHVLGDFYLQKGQWVACRNTHHYASWGLCKHILSHIGLLVIALWLAGELSVKGWIAIVLIGFSHLLIDIWKSYQADKLVYFLLDQFFHVLIVALAAWGLNGADIELIQSQLLSLLTVKYLAVGCAYVIACRPASIAISIALNHYTAQLKDKQTGLASAGCWIGYLERCLIISFILIGQFAGVGFLLAAKTIFRFGDLTKERDMKLTEYMMLGTLLSFSCALMLGWWVNRL